MWKSGDVGSSCGVWVVVRSRREVSKLVWWEERDGMTAARETSRATMESAGRVVEELGRNCDCL